MSVTIYHNPSCGTSRNTLAMIRNSGAEPEVIEYLKTPPTRDKLKAMIADAGLTVRDSLRSKGTPFDELGLDGPALFDLAKMLPPDWNTRRYLWPSTTTAKSSGASR